VTAADLLKAHSLAVAVFGGSHHRGSLYRVGGGGREAVHARVNTVTPGSVAAATTASFFGCAGYAPHSFTAHCTSRFAQTIVRNGTTCAARAARVHTSPGGGLAGETWAFCISTAHGCFLARDVSRLLACTPLANRVWIVWVEDADIFVFFHQHAQLGCGLVLLLLRCARFAVCRYLCRHSPPRQHWQTPFRASRRIAFRGSSARFPPAHRYACAAPYLQSRRCWEHRRTLAGFLPLALVNMLDESRRFQRKGRRR